MILVHVSVWSLIGVGWLFGCLATMLVGYIAADAKSYWQHRSRK